MAIVGVDGNNAPRLIDGIPARLWMGIQARAYTYFRREPFNPEFGLGLVDGIGSPNLTTAEWLRRLRESFGELEGYEHISLGVVRGAGVIELRVGIERDD